MPPAVDLAAKFVIDAHGLTRSAEHREGPLRDHGEGAIPRAIIAAQSGISSC